MRSRNRCCCGKAISFTYSQYVYVVLVIQQAMCMRRIIFVICGLSGCTSFLYITRLSPTARFSENPVIEHKMCV